MSSIWLSTPLETRQRLPASFIPPRLGIANGPAVVAARCHVQTLVVGMWSGRDAAPRAQTGETQACDLLRTAGACPGGRLIRRLPRRPPKTLFLTAGLVPAEG